MKNSQDIIREIGELTIHMKTNYPELYRSLDEDPITLPECNHPHMDRQIMQDYLDSLKQLLKHYLETSSIDKMESYDI